MSTPAELQALFANIKPRRSPNSASNTPVAEAQAYRQNGSPSGEAGFAPPPGFHQATVSSPIYSPQYAGTPPHHGSDIISPNVPTPRNNQTPQQPLNADRTSNLLNLLKFSSASQNASSPMPPQEDAGALKDVQGEGPVGSTQSSHGRGISASDIVASFMGKPGVSAPGATGSMPSDPSAAQPPERASATSPSADNAQNMLLKLLNRPKPQASKSEESVNAAAGAKSPAAAAPREPSTDAGVGSPTERQGSPMRLFGTGESREATPFEPPVQQQQKDTIFTYVNPFEQLAAASPRHRSPQGNQPRGLGGASAAPDGASTKKNGTTTGHRKRSEPSEDVNPSSLPLKSGENVAIPPGSGGFEDSQGPDQKKMKIKKETVFEALGEVAGQVDKEVEDALARATADETIHVKQEPEEEDSKAVLDSLAEELGKTALDAQEGLDKDTSGESLPKGSPPVVSDTKEAPTVVANDAVVDSWESDTGRIIPVYNFPLKPFVSITWKGNTENPSPIRTDGIMDIARLKKDFDQLDRTLTSATSEYIVYALAKNGGMRIVRQDDGLDRQVFRSTNDRVFNVSLSATASFHSSAVKEQAVLGIGVSGTVYWATVVKSDEDLFEQDVLERDSLIFPPFPASDENTSGGQLKTRARRSSRHPEFFAIGRGKSIHIVWPHSAMSPKYGVTKSRREVDTEKFFKEKSLKIATGKAGKDFIFSDDDTVIVSLDKTGRMRFWDIRDVGDFPNTTTTSKASTDIRVPLLTLVTGSPTEKSWPTSVLFIDKLRPYVKVSALRYVLVGLKQNHTLQLWDIGLGKAVQELNFPHDNESDAICSVAYHPGSGIIVVGHPTRNSIYFVHLSAPRYSLPQMSQGTYIQRVAEKDERLPRPESTACMSGIRELSFGSKGQLRSLELLPLTRPPTSAPDLDEAGLFELYVMHSHGVTCLNIKKSDLGWSSENKILDPVNALQKGFIDVNPLQSFPAQIDEQSVNGDAASKAVSKGKEPAKKMAGPPSESATGIESSRNQSPSKQSPKKKAGDSVSTADQNDQLSTTTDKSEKRKKKRAEGGKAKETPTKDVDQAQVQMQQSMAVSESNVSSRVPSESGPGEAINLGISSDFLNKEIKKIEKAVSAEFTKSFSRELNTLYTRFDQDRRAQDQAATAKQDAVLRLVSSTLSDNVEKNLSRIITNNVQSMVVPTLVETTSKSMDQQIKEGLGRQLDSILPAALKDVLPPVIQRAVQSENVLHRISELVSASVSSRVEKDLTKFLHEKIVPSFKEQSNQQARLMTKEVERQFVSQLRQYELRQHNDSTKIDQLTTLVHSLSETISTMAAAQSRFQNEILELNRQLGTKTSAPEMPPAPAPAPRNLSPEEVELEEISDLMKAGRYEEGAIRWIQSSQQADLFDNLFIKQDPSFLSDLAPLVILSVSAAVTSSLDTNVMKRLDWLERVFQIVRVRDPEIYEVAPKIMGVLIQRLDALYMAIAKNNPHDHTLRRIPHLSRWARDLQQYKQ